MERRLHGAGDPHIGNCIQSVGPFELSEGRIAGRTGGVFGTNSETLQWPLREPRIKHGFVV